MSSTRRHRTDRFFNIFFKATGLLTIALLAGIFSLLLWNTVQFFWRTGLGDFFTGLRWDPDTDYGVAPLLASTGLVALGAMAIAIPLGVLTAAYLAEFAPRRVAVWLKPVIEILASVPSVAIGFLGIVLVGPALSWFFGFQNGLNALNGSILLAVMALPTIVTVCEDAIRAVPFSYKEGSIGLGASRWQTLFRVTLPAALPGLIAAVLLGLGRALGETMTVLMATGNASAFPKGFLDSVRTITATIAIEMGEVPYQTTHYYALFAIAMILFLITLAVNIIGEYFSHRLRRYLE